MNSTEIKPLNLKLAIFIILIFSTISLPQSIPNVSDSTKCTDIGGEWVIQICDSKEPDCRGSFCRCPRGLYLNDSVCEKIPNKILCESSDGRWIENSCVCPNNSIGFKEGFGCDYISTSQNNQNTLLSYAIAGIIIAFLITLFILRIRLQRKKGILILIIFSLSLAGVSWAESKDSLKTSDSMTGISENLLISHDRIQEKNFSVIIVLKNQPISQTSKEIKERNLPEIEKYTSQLNSIETKFIKISEDKARYSTLQELVDIQISNLSTAEKYKLNYLRKEVDKKQDEIKRDIYETQSERTMESQESVKETLKNCNANITGNSVIINSIFARISSDCLDKLKRNDEVLAVYEDEIKKSNLEKSICSIGAPSWHSAGYTGGVWDLAIVDTGIDGTHPALDVDFAKTFHNSGILDPIYNDDQNSVDDFHGHGTHMAGVVASTDSTNRGVAYGLDALINAKAGYKTTEFFFFDNGRMIDSDAMQAIDWAINTAGADVISRSFGMCGGGSNDCALARYLDAVVDDLGVSVVNSAGNDGPDIGTVGAPAYNIFSVAATDDKNTCTFSGDISDDNIAGFSSRGPTPNGRVKPDIAVPGTNIKSTNHDWEGLFGLNPDFVDGSGTSPAAPHVAGSILLVLDYKGLRWDPKAMKALFYNTANNDGIFSDKNSFGWGYLDLNHAFVHKDDVFIDSVVEGGYKFYSGSNIFSGNKATLVWNRHVTYNGVNYPTEVFSLNDLDLYMYDESTGNLIDKSITGNDNVEQVEASSSYSNIVLRVDAFSQDFTHNLDIEEFALATEEGHQTRGGPVLNFEHEVPFMVKDSELPFIIKQTISNSGDLNMHGVSVGLSVPAGMIIVGGGNLLSSKIEPGNNMSTNWYVTGNLGNYDGIYSLYSSDSYGESFSGFAGFSSVNITDDDADPPDFDRWNYSSFILSTENVTVRLNISDISGLSKVTLHYDYGNDGVEDGNIFMVQLGNTETWTATIPAPGKLFENTYLSFFVEASDTDNDRLDDSMTGISTTQYIYLMSENPSIEFVFPSDIYNAVVKRNYTEINVSISGINSIDYCTLEWNGTNYSMSKIGNGTSVTCYINKTDFNGFYVFRVYANDVKGIIGISNFRDITFNGSLTVIIISPMEETYSNVGNLLTVFSDKKVKDIYMALNSNRFTKLCSNCNYYNKTINGREKTNTILLRFIDYDNTEVQKLVSFVVDTKKPVISRILPMNRRYVGGLTNFSIKYTEDNVANITLLYGNDLVQEEFIGCQSGINRECSKVVNISNYTGNTIKYYFIVKDEFNNVPSRIYSINIDATVPNITVISPENLSYSNTRMRTTFLISEKVKLEYSDNAKSFVTLCSSCTLYNTTRTFSRGVHKLVLRATDKAGNQGYASVGFTIA